MEAEHDHEASLRGQAQIWKYIFSFADSMALKCAVELRIPDVINSHVGGPISLPEIASRISGASSPDIPCLARIMRLLVRRKIFSVHRPSDGGEPLYGLTHSSRWLLRDTPDLTLAPLLLLADHPKAITPWHCFADCVRHGGAGAGAAERAYGKELYDSAAEDPELNEMFNDGMACTARIAMRAVLGAEYGDRGFRGLRSLVDIGGGTGGAAAEIVKLYPQIEGINFDLPHVVATAPEYPGVSHVGGDMFESIPNADAVFMKWILHNWSDEDCVKILKNCAKAIPKENGKVIIVEIILEPEGNGLFDDTAMIYDLLMLAHFSGGKERTESEWDKILKEAGFTRYNIIKTPSLLSIIEAYPA